MIRSCLFVLGAVVSLSTSAFADYYIVHGPDRHCRVVEKYVPGERDIIRVGPLSFGTRQEAERELKVICKDRGYYRDEYRREERR